MGYLILGFITGVAVSWFWQRQFSAVPAFRQLMQKELALNGQLGSITVLKKRLESMEKKIAELESASEEAQNDLAVIDESAVSSEGGAPGLTQAGTLVMVKGAKADSPSARRNSLKVARSEALAMWQEGKSVDQIAARTGLGRGEVELLIALKRNRGKT